MADLGKPSERHLEAEMKVIHLMLRHRDVVDELLNDGYRIDLFETVHRQLVQAIYEEYTRSNNKRLLTRNGYQQFIIEQGDKQNLVPRMSVYDRCDIKAYADKNDIGHLKRQVMEGYAGRSLRKALQDANSNASKKGFLFAMQELRDQIDSSLVAAESQKAVYSSVNELRDEFMEQLKQEKANPQSMITCKIPEIDSVMNVGFRPMHLTLVVGDVGSHKTNVMLNIALNISEQGHKVLFVPLEMTWRDLMNRIVCNRADVNSQYLANPRILPDEDMKKIGSSTLWDNKNFAILDAYQRMDMRVLKREIEKRAMAFGPKVVVIDYADIIQTDAKYQSRTIEIGEMLHSLRTMGKQYGFHILSAAQMNRAAIKALREGDDAALDSTAIHGSHSYSTTADTIFGLQRVAEKDKIKIHSIKARHGPAGIVGELHVNPSRYLITSTNGTLAMTSESDLDGDIHRTPSEIAEKLDTPLPSVAFQGCDLDDLDSLVSDPLSEL